MSHSCSYSGSHPLNASSKCNVLFSGFHWKIVQRLYFLAAYIFYNILCHITKAWKIWKVLNIFSGTAANHLKLMTEISFSEIFVIFMYSQPMRVNIKIKIINLETETILVEWQWLCISIIFNERQWLYWYYFYWIGRNHFLIYFASNVNKTN